MCIARLEELRSVMSTSTSDPVRTAFSLVSRAKVKGAVGVWAELVADAVKTIRISRRFRKVFISAPSKTKPARMGHPYRGSQSRNRFAELRMFHPPSLLGTRSRRLHLVSSSSNQPFTGLADPSGGILCCPRPSTTASINRCNIPGFCRRDTCWARSLRHTSPRFPQV
jgi:hypothetical protein